MFRHAFYHARIRRTTSTSHSPSQVFVFSRIGDQATNYESLQNPTTTTSTTTTSFSSSSSSTTTSIITATRQFSIVHTSSTQADVCSGCSILFMISAVCHRLSKQRRLPQPVP
uniref:Uncharacterized protein n=1 Tax=Mesocestoides corti TaxID=53468 RepID=A0A5K3FX72_MESCO